MQRYGYVLLAAMMAVPAWWPLEAEAQQPCPRCYRPANPKDRNPDRRVDRPNTLETPDGRDSNSRPTELPGAGNDSRDFVPPPEFAKPVPGDVAPEEVLPPPSNS